MSSRLRGSIFAGLIFERKVEACQWFLSFEQGSPDIVRAYLFFQTSYVV